MTDFLNDLIARSAGTPQIVRPRPASVFDPVEPGAWPLPAEGQGEGPDDRAGAAAEVDVPEVAPAPQDRPPHRDIAPEMRQGNRGVDRPGATAPDQSPETPQTARAPRVHPKPTPMMNTPGPLRPEITLAAREETRPLASPAGDTTPGPSREADAHRRPESAEDRTADAASARSRGDIAPPTPPLVPPLDEDALARLLRKMVSPPRSVNPAEATPDRSRRATEPALPLAPAVVANNGPPSPAQSSGRQPVGPLTLPGQDDMRPARADGSRTEPEGAPHRRRRFEPSRGEAPVARLAPLPERLADFPPVPPAETTVHITIGRIEVRASPNQPEPVALRRPEPKLMSLEDYLSQRSVRDG